MINNHIRLRFAFSIFILLLIIALSPHLSQSQAIEGLQIFSGASHKNTINDIFCEGSYVWCATEGGLVKWNTLDMSYEIFSISDGLGSSRTYSIGQETDSILWIGTSFGASLFDGATWETHRYINTSNSGKVPFIINDIVNNNGDIWFSMWSKVLIIIKSHPQNAVQISN